MVYHNKYECTFSLFAAILQLCKPNRTEGRRTAHPWVDGLMDRQSDEKSTERSEGKTRGHKINWRFLTTGCEGMETKRWMSVVPGVMGIENG